MAVIILIFLLKVGLNMSFELYFSVACCQDYYLKMFNRYFLLSLCWT